MRDICLFTVTNTKRGRGLSCFCPYADKHNTSVGSPKDLCPQPAPGTVSLHSPIGSSLLTAYELLIGSRTGQDCHLQLPGQGWLSPREQGGSASAGPDAPWFFNTKNDVAGESQTPAAEKQVIFWAVPDGSRPGSSNPRLGETRLILKAI